MGEMATFMQSITYVNWSVTMGDDYYYYYLNLIEVVVANYPAAVSSMV